MIPRHTMPDQERMREATPAPVSPTPAVVRRAVIDIGTNSVKLLVAEVSGRRVRPLWEESEQTRLGRDFYDTHRLQPEAIQGTAHAVAQFAATARAHRAEATRVIATSAARDAVNQAELLAAIERSAQLKVEIISGEQEAEWVFQGVTSDPALAGRRLLIMDVGGGSTEFILGEGEYRQFRQSFPLGSLRLLERMPHGDPPTPLQMADCRAWLNDFIGSRVRPALNPWLENGPGDWQLIGTGGAATILARMEAQLGDYDRERIEATRLSVAAVGRWMERLWSLSLADRKRIIGLPKKRADVILSGAAIYEAVMQQLGFKELQVSTRGLRYAAVM